MLVLCVAAIELWRPLAGLAVDAPGADPLGQTRSDQDWELRTVEPGGPWRVLVAPGGDLVTLPAPPRRVASQIVLTDELLQALGAVDLMVAHSALADDARYSHLVGVELPGVAVSNNAEAILGLEPDLALVASYSTLETVTQLREAGVPVLQLSQFDSLGAIRRNIEVIGFALGHDEAAAGLVAAFDGRLAALKERCAGKAPATTVLSWSDGSVPAIGTIFDDVTTVMGLVNPASADGLRGWPVVSAEQVARWDPNWLLIPSAPDDDGAAKRAITEHVVLGETRAARSGRVIVVPSACHLAVSHHALCLVEAVANAVCGKPT